MGKEGELLNLIGPICHSRLTLPTSVYESFSNLPIGPNVPTAWEGSRLRAPGETSQAELTSKGRPGVRLRVHHRKPGWPLAGMIAPENPGPVTPRKRVLPLPVSVIPRLIRGDGWAREKGWACWITVTGPRGLSPLMQLDGG